MGYLLTLVFLILAASLALSLVRRGPYLKLARLFRFFSVVLSLAFFIYWFMQKSVNQLVKDSLAIQIVNKLPQPVDFYIIEKGDRSQPETTLHSGIVRPDHYRIENLRMNSDEYWVVGYLGKKNMVYFSQHILQSKNMDQILEVRNYIIQSRQLSDSAKKIIENYALGQMSMAVWTALSLLLLFMNIILLGKRQ